MLQLYKDSGIDANAFQGVPVFQAEGLTVNSDGGRQTPLFLSKEDLDKAIHAAFSQREAFRQEQTAAKHRRAQEELDIAKAKVSACPVGILCVIALYSCALKAKFGLRSALCSITACSLCPASLTQRSLSWCAELEGGQI